MMIRWQTERNEPENPESIAYCCWKLAICENQTDSIETHHVTTSNVFTKTISPELPNVNLWHNFMVAALGDTVWAKERWDATMQEIEKKNNSETMPWNDPFWLQIVCLFNHCVCVALRSVGHCWQKFGGQLNIYKCYKRPCLYGLLLTERIICDTSTENLHSTCPPIVLNGGSGDLCTYADSEFHSIYTFRFFSTFACTKRLIKLIADWMIGRNDGAYWV